MNASSVAWRGWRSFLGEREPHCPRAPGRGRDGYSLGQRIWASFVGVDLPADRFAATPARRVSPVPPGSPAERSNRGTSQLGPLAPGWFTLPRILDAGGLTAAGDDEVVLEASSPDGETRFLVRADEADQPEYTLEVVLHDVDATGLAFCAVRYVNASGDEQVLLVPVIQGQFGPPASLVRLPGFTADSTAGWTARVPVPAPATTTWDAVTVAVSVRAALNEATRDAWRRVKDLAGEEMSGVIGTELR